MATSNSYDWTLTRDNIIKQALTRLKVIDADGTPTTSQINSGSVVLNAMVKSWRTESIFLWSLEEKDLSLTPADKVVGTDGNDYICIKDHTSDSTKKPITGAYWTSYWIATGTTGEGSAWADATAYNSIVQYSLAAEIIGIERPFLRNSDGADTPLTVLTREQYMALGSKYTTGNPTAVYFKRELGQSTLIFNPMPENDSVDVLHYDAIKKVQDFDAADDNPDFPEEWFEALYLNLAYKLCMNYNLPMQERRELQNEALMAKAVAKYGESQATNLQVTPRLK